MKIYFFYQLKQYITKLFSIWHMQKMLWVEIESVAKTEWKIFEKSPSSQAGFSQYFLAKGSISGWSL